MNCGGTNQHFILRTQNHPEIKARNNIEINNRLLVFGQHNAYRDTLGLYTWVVHSNIPWKPCGHYAGQRHTLETMWSLRRSKTSNARSAKVAYVAEPQKIAMAYNKQKERKNKQESTVNTELYMSHEMSNTSANS